jgi:hypothetical protein
LEGGEEMAKGHKIGRDAGNGQFIPVKTAQQRPKTTTVETLPAPKKGK